MKRITKSTKSLKVPCELDEDEEDPDRDENENRLNGNQLIRNIEMPFST